MILLINPPWGVRKRNYWGRIRSTYPPLGLLYLAAVLERDGHATRILDAHAEGLGIDGIMARVREVGPRIVGITTTTVTAPAAYRVAAAVKEVSPGTTVVMGGVHVSSLPEEALTTGTVDIVVIGEGEEAILGIARGDAPERINGLAYQEDGSIRRTPPGDIVHSLDSLPSPAYHLVPVERYRPAVGAYKRLPAIEIMASRGCPGRCIFCRSAGTPHRTRSPELIVEEIEEMIERYGIREISFYDDTFTARKKNVIPFCEMILSRGIDITWSCFARTDCIDAEMLGMMRRSGCHQILYGLESASEEILRTIRKPIPIEKTKRAIEATKRAGIEVRAAFMLGNMRETRETMEETVRFALELDPDLVLFNIAVPFPGTEMYRWADEGGYLVTKDWERYDLSRSVVDLPTVPREEVERKQREAYRRFYLRPSFILRRMGRIRRPGDLVESLRGLGAVLGI